MSVMSDAAWMMAIIEVGNQLQRTCSLPNEQSSDGKVAAASSKSEFSQRHYLRL